MLLRNRLLNFIFFHHYFWIQTTEFQYSKLKIETTIRMNEIKTKILQNPDEASVSQQIIKKSSLGALEIARYLWKRNVQGQWNQLCFVLMQLHWKIRTTRRSGKKAIGKFLLSLVSVFSAILPGSSITLYYTTEIRNNSGKYGIPGISATV